MGIGHRQFTTAHMTALAAAHLCNTQPEIAPTRVPARVVLVVSDDDAPTGERLVRRAAEKAVTYAISASSSSECVWNCPIDTTEWGDKVNKFGERESQMPFYRKLKGRRRKR